MVLDGPRWFRCGFKLVLNKGFWLLTDVWKMVLGGSSGILDVFWKVLGSQQGLALVLTLLFFLLLLK